MRRTLLIQKPNLLNGWDVILKPAVKPGNCCTNCFGGRKNLNGGVIKFEFLFCNFRMRSDLYTIESDSRRTGFPLWITPMAGRNHKAEFSIQKDCMRWGTD